MPVLFITAAALGYLLGAIPFGYLVARFHGVNIFEVGSKSPGATNVRRVLGPNPGTLVFVLDALKGAVATVWPMLAAGGAAAAGHPTAQTVAFSVAGLAGALLGHSFSCFTRFRGGKGVATGAGGFMVLMPVVTLIGLMVWIAIFFTTRYVSLASMLAALSLPFSAWALGRHGLLIGIAAALAAFVIYRHRANCARLFKGTEHRFGREKLPEKKP